MKLKKSKHKKFLAAIGTRTTPTNSKAMPENEPVTDEPGEKDDK